jgi:hypothetical protein
MSKRIAATNVRLKRAYDPPAASDGTRVLVDRLWPRGIRKAGAAIDQWKKISHLVQSYVIGLDMIPSVGTNFDDDTRMRFTDIGNSSTNCARTLDPVELHSFLRLTTNSITMPSS